MEQNLDLALQKLFGGEVEQEQETEATSTTTTTGSVQTDRQMAIEALSHYRKSQEFLRLGNWAGYGDELEKMEDMLRAIENRKRAGYFAEVTLFKFLGRSPYLDYSY